MEIINQIWQVLSGAYTSYGAAILQIIGGCAAMAAVTPNKIDNMIFDGIKKVINLIGMNWGYAKNSDEKKMTWLETLKLFLIAVTELAKTLKVWLEFRSHQLLWDMRDKQNEYTKKSLSEIEVLRNTRLGNDADRLCDDVAARSGVLDALSAKLPVSQEGDACENNGGSPHSSS